MIAVPRDPASAPRGWLPAAAIVLALAPLPASAQQVQDLPARIERPAATPDQPPGELSVAQKAALLAELRPSTPAGSDDGILELDTTSGPWKVHPVRPIAPDRAHLRFANVRFLDARPDLPPVAYLSPTDPDDPPTSAVTLVFSPVAAGAAYLVDCAVGSSGGLHRVRVGPGGSEQTFSGTEHLVLVYTAPSTSPAEFTITGHGQTGPWRFYGCEITPLRR